MRRTLLTLLAAACAAALLMTAPAAADPTYCRATRLPTLGDDHTDLWGGDPSGRYLVGFGHRTNSPDANYRSLVWERGKPRLLDTEPLRPHVQVQPMGVNEHGVIVGYRITDWDTFHRDAWMYRNGRFSLLPGLTPTSETEPSAINARGDVVGMSLQTGGWRAVVWPADQPGTVRELTVPEGADDTYAFDVDDDGTVLGLALEGEFDSAPHVWPPNGAPYQLPRPAGFNGRLWGSEISNGWVAGDGEREREGERSGLLWNLRDQTVQVSSAEFESYTSVNRSGTVGARGAIIHPDGRIVRLRADGYPRLVTDNGDAAGTVTGLNLPVVWTGC